MAETDPIMPPTAGPTTPPPTPAPEPAQGEQHVPYTRFKQVNDELKTLKQQIATLTGEKEQQSSAAKTLEQRLASLESALQTERAAKERLEVATTKKLPPELAGRLQGATREELEADADRLLAFIKPATGPGVPPPGSGSRPPAGFDMVGKSPAEIREAYRAGKIKLS